MSSASITWVVLRLAASSIRHGELAKRHVIHRCDYEMCQIVGWQPFL
jgi:hypothetical protein